jgi:hypothetical protein
MMTAECNRGMGRDGHAIVAARVGQARTPAPRDGSGGTDW